MSASTERSPASTIRLIRLALGVITLVIGIAAAYDSLPAFFMVLAAMMVLLALGALFQSLRTAFGDAGSSTAVRATLPERAALVDEKNALLRAIKDIAFEHEVGKLSDADFERLDRAYRHRAKEVLRKLDEDLAPFLDRAERLVSEAISEEEPARAPTGKKAKGKKKKKEQAVPRRECPACGTSNAPDAAHCKECGANVVPLKCPACETINEADAKFCKKCAAALKPIAVEAAADEPEAGAAEGEDA